MNVCRRPFAIIAILLAVGVAAGPRARGEEPRTKATKDSRPAEFKVLDGLVGAWGPANNNFKAARAKWAIDGAYLQIDKSFNRENKTDTVTLLTWDDRKKCYRCWEFTSLDLGAPQQGEGSWDDKSKTLTFTCPPNADGSALVITYTIAGDDLTYKEGIKDKAGKVDSGRLTCEWKKRGE